MATKKAPVKTLDKKAMKSTRGGGVMIPDAMPAPNSGVMVPDLRKAGGDGI
ncbi:MAG TPA: hypothetical protein VF950_30240 [Planctomycetota bacterium]